MNVSTITYHDRLRRCRLDRGLSQTDLADRIGISVATISNVERGTRDLTAPKLFAWARACGASLEWIAGEPVSVPAHVDETLQPLPTLEPPTLAEHRADLRRALGMGA